MRRTERVKYLKLIAALAWPTIIEQILTTAVSYVDTAMVGALGKRASATVGATMTVNWMLGGVVMAFGIGFLAYIARSIGAGKNEQAKRAAAQSVTVALLTGLVLTVLALTLARFVPVWMRADKDIRAGASEYFFIIYIPMIFRSASITFGTVIRAAGDTRKPMIVNTVTNLVNVVLNFLLIYPTRKIALLGLDVRMPGAGLGVRGAAIASAIAFTVGGAWMTIELFRNPRISPKGYSLKPDRQILIPCFKIALPACLQRLVTSLGYVTFSSMINSLGETATAAHSIANTAESAFYIPGWGMQTAASTLIGNAYGERDKVKLKGLSRILLTLEFVVMLISGTVLFTGAETLMRLFTKDAEVIRMGATVLRMVALSEPIYGLAIIMEGIFNGVGDTFHSFIFNAIGMWGIRILGTFLCVKVFNGNLTSAWACMIAHNVSLGIMLSVKYLYGHWQPGNFDGTAYVQ